MADCGRGNENEDTTTRVRISEDVNKRKIGIDDGNGHEIRIRNAMECKYIVMMIPID